MELVFIGVGSGLCFAPCSSGVARKNFALRYAENSDLQKVTEGNEDSHIRVRLTSSRVSMFVF